MSTRGAWGGLLRQMAPGRKVLKQQLKRGNPRHASQDAGQPPEIVQEINELARGWKKRLGPWKKQTGGAFTLGSDCSGYGSELCAVRLLGLQSRARLLMVSEINETKLALHRAMAEACDVDTSQCQTFADIGDRNDKEAPRVDLYCAGYPCPSWSRMGKRKGVKDPRGMVTLHGLRYIASQRPRALILEQVSSLLDKNHKQIWNFLQKVLKWLEYEFTFDKLNTRQFGIPQSRPRLYILAVCKESLRCPLVMPAPRDTQPDLHTFLDKSVQGSERLTLPNYEKKLGADMWTSGYVLDIAASPRFQHILKNCCPCLTRTRCKDDGFYIPKLKRQLTSLEIARLQGLPRQVADSMLAAAQDMPKRAFEEAAGDAMSVNVLQTAMRRCCDSAGLTSLGDGKDYWLKCPASRCFQLSDSLWDKHRK